jgi:MFS family permease
MRSVRLLAIAQALCNSGSFLVVLLGGILGSQLAPRPALATLPLSAMIVGLAVATFPAALLMQRFGRRNVFQVTALIAACASLLAAQAVHAGRFSLFCLATCLLGATNAVVMQYRFAATEHVEPELAGRAIATVMVGALVAAWLGPEVAILGADLVPGAHYAGSFYCGAGLFTTAAVLLSALPRRGAALTSAGGSLRPFGEIARQPEFKVAVLAGVVAYAVMSFIMTATPISMHVMDHHSEQDTKWVIQSHLLAMYLPALFSGRIVVRLGVHLTMLIGTLTMCGCVAIALAGGHAVAHYWWAMVLLGVGWNLLFVAGTTMLTRTYRPAERFRAQAVNELTVFGSQAVASLLAGVALAYVGWERLNLASLPLLVAMLASVLWLMVHRRTRRPSQPA